MKKINLLALLAVLTLSTIGCTAKPTAEVETTAEKQTVETTETLKEAAGIKDGIYRVESTGMHEGLKLDVTIVDGKISAVEVISHGETEGISDAALERIPQEIVENNSINVDVVAGATMTSNGIINGVKKGIEKAGGKVDDFNTKNLENIEKTEEKLEADVVIAGAGLTGLTTAISAAENGMDVIIVEKMPQAGGSLAMAMGSFLNVESEAGSRLGVEVAEENLLDFWHQTAEYGPDKLEQYPNFDRVNTILGEVGTQLDWLEDHGVVFNMAIPASPYLPSMLVTDSGAAVASSLLNSAEKVGVKILLETPATELIVEEGKVIGLKAESKTVDYTIRAPHVVLATGGIGNSPEMIHEMMPQFDDFVTQVAAGHTGDGIEMALDVGAQVYDHYWVLTTNLTTLSDFTAVAPGAAALSLTDKLMVDQTGVRYVNEAFEGMSYVSNVLSQRETDSFVLFDSGDETVTAILETGLASGTVFKGNTPETVAEAAGIDPAVFAETFEKYNSDAKAGKDEVFGKAAALMIPYADGPFYAVKVTGNIIGTYGGVRTDVDSHVLNAEGEIIEGLYALGEMSNREYYNESYVPCASLTMYSTVARLLGESFVE